MLIENRSSKSVLIECILYETIIDLGKYCSNNERT